jgi:hypothetical protein
MWWFGPKVARRVIQLGVTFSTIILAHHSNFFVQKYGVYRAIMKPLRVNADLPNCGQNKRRT